MQRKTFGEEIRPKEIYSAKTSCSSKIPIPTLIIAQNNIHGFRLPEAWSPVSKLFSERNLYYFCPHWHTSSFHIEQQDGKIFVVQKNQFPGRNFTAKYFQQKPFVGVFSPHISLPKIQGFLVFKFYIRYARSSLVHCEKENIGRIVSGGKQ